MQKPNIFTCFVQKPRKMSPKIISLCYTVGFVCLPLLSIVCYKRALVFFKNRNSLLYADCLITADHSNCKDAHVHRSDAAFTDVCSNPFCYRIVMNKLLKLIDSSRESILVCVYLITSEELAKALVLAHQRNVEVRVVIDADMAACSGSRCSYFQNNGIEVRKNKPQQELMHHKFFLIDTMPKKVSREREHSILPKNGVIGVGSMNWTMQAIRGNWEFINVTSDVEVISAYRNEFERMWELFGTS